MVTTDQFDEPALLRQLDRLDRPLKTAFAGACAERLWPLVQRFASKAALPADQVKALRTALDAVWRSCTGGSEDIAGVQLLAESMVPGEDDQWVFEAGYGENGIAAVAYAARTWLTNEPQEAVRAARQLYEAADYGAQQRLLEVTEYSVDVEGDLRHSAVVRGALNAIRADLEAAGQGDPSIVREQARAGAGELARIFP